MDVHQAVDFFVTVRQAEVTALAEHSTLITTEKTEVETSQGDVRGGDGTVPVTPVSVPAGPYLAVCTLDATDRV